MAYSYGLNRAERADDYKTARELIFVLIDLVSRGGNLLLDIGPAADGTIPPLMEERLLEMGAWLRVNGEAIYGTRCAARTAQWTEGTRPRQDYGEYRVKYNLMDQIGQSPRDGLAVKQVFFTQKPDALYAIMAGWPGARLALHGVTVPAGATLTLLGRAEPLAWRAGGDGVEVALPDLGPEDAPCRYAFTIKLPGGKVAPEAN